jgi:thiol-disulfide isomerase/thioredoxin
MSIEAGVSMESVAAVPQTQVASGLNRASELQHAGKFGEALAELETTLATARATPYEIEFQTRIRLGIALSEIYLSLDRIQDARALLTDEAAFAERISQIMQATGTLNQKRAATGGYLQVRDRAAQVGLIGEPAPEVSVKDWIVGEPITLAGLKGRVVLLEFWATWCKPCQEMFPKLNSLYDAHAADGLEVIAITRHYMAYGGTTEAMNDELQLIRSTVAQHGVKFRVGVAADEQLQTVYGANGLPTAVLIDRSGIVRYAGPGAEDKPFIPALLECLGA